MSVRRLRISLACLVRDQGSALWLSDEPEQQSHTALFLPSRCWGDLVMPLGHIFSSLGKSLHFSPGVFVLVTFCEFPVTFW